MDLVSTIAACSLVEDVRLVVAMAIAFSGGHPYAMQTISQREEDTSSAYATELRDSDGDVDNTSVAKPRTSEQAGVELQRRLSDGDTVVVGLVPVPALLATEFGRQPAELLNTCTNVSIATAKLAEWASACRPRTSRACVLKRYARATGMVGFADDVLDVLRSRLDAPRDVLPSVDSSAALARDTPADALWGANQLFFAIPEQDSLHGAASQNAALGNGQARP
jgi:hypothetical protein